MAIVTGLNTFTAGTPAKASEVNTNFAVVKSFVEGLSSGTNIDAGAITTSKIADGTILNTDIDAAAAIDLTKLGTGLLPSTITVNSNNIQNGSITSSDISANTIIAANMADNTIVQSIGAPTTASYAPTIYSLSGLTSTLNRTMFVPIYIGETITFTQISIHTGTQSGTAVYRLGIYTNTNGLPTTVVRDFGQVSVSSSSFVASITQSYALTKGWYWLACNMQQAGTTNTLNGGSPYGTMMNRTTSSGESTNCYYQSGVSGAFATAVGVVPVASAPQIILTRA